MLELTKSIPDTYGEVAFYWWTGEPLRKDRLRWQLDQLKGHHICALQINYCHGDKGGVDYGLTMDSEPPVFSPEWWELVVWFVGECKKEGIAVALSDYTLSAPGQEKYMDEILRNHPEYAGKKLVIEDGEIRVITVPHSVNPMEPGLGDAVIEAFFAQFEQRFPQEMGQAINFFFSDELVFHVSGTLWDDVFLEEFEKRKGYDLEPYLRGIFEDIGPITQKVRLDYYDVIVSRMEEGYFKKIYDWNEARGMTMGCDHGGRGLDVVEFGDYFRTQRWNQGPGNDQPNLESNLIKSKVSASIAHMYRRPRVWLEGFYGSGWGTSSAELADAVFRNFALGHNLLTLHGLYYTTYGGYWEWAPPCNHFRMPYWKHMKAFLSCTKTFSYLMAQGVHVCDVAIIYPVAAMAGGLDGKEAVEAAFKLANDLYRKHIDFDFIDEASVAGAVVQDGKLCVSGEQFSTLIFPAMKTVHVSSIEKALELQAQGGNVVLYQAAPLAGDRVGREDTALQAAVSSLLNRQRMLNSCEAVVESIRRQGPVDFTVNAEDIGERTVYIHHRRWDGRDLYVVYGIRANSRVFFRAFGQVTRFDPWTMKEIIIPVLEQTEEGTWLRSPLSETELAIYVFDPRMKADVVEPSCKKACNHRLAEEAKKRTVTLNGSWRWKLLPTMDNTFGDFRLPVEQRMIGAEARYLNWSDGKRSKRIRYSVGTYFSQIGPMQEADDEALLYADNLQPGAVVAIGENKYIAKEYDFSLRSGIEGDAGYQHSYHGLKGYVSDAFIALGNRRVTQANSNSVYEQELGGRIYYLYTRVRCDRTRKVSICQGEKQADKVYLDRKEVQKDQQTQSFIMEEGIHELLLRYDGPGRTWFVLQNEPAVEFNPFILSMRWYGNPNVLPFSPFLGDENGLSRFGLGLPPACRQLSFSSLRPLALREGEVVVPAVSTGVDAFGIPTYTIEVPGPKQERSYVELITTDVGQTSLNDNRGIRPSGFFAGSVETILTSPVIFDCGEGIAAPGDWGEWDGMETYSGGARYEKTIHVDAKELHCQLDLGEVGCSAEVFVNGKSAGIRMTKPYQYELDGLLMSGDNEICIEVYNTLYNHYKTIPTQYNQRVQVSGLIGPVTITYQGLRDVISVPKQDG